MEIRDRLKELLANTYGDLFLQEFAEACGLSRVSPRDFEGIRNRSLESSLEKITPETSDRNVVLIVDGAVKDQLSECGRIVQYEPQEGRKPTARELQS